jgi:threonine synthase
MKWVSTRGQAAPLATSEAIAAGLASDGGLLVPERWPKLAIENSWAELPFAELAQKILLAFLSTSADLAKICQQAFTFPVPLRALSDGTQVLELFHGPTCAFKDFGARFLALNMKTLPQSGGSPLVLVATSGDTGGAVAAAFCEFTAIPVVILFPVGGVSKRQEAQLTSWGDQVRALAVHGNFDDCQRLVKEAFASHWWTKQFQLISANSINIGRLLPQMVYFASASLQYQQRFGRAPGFVVPSGNLGDGMAALWARQLGFPIRQVIFAHNANRAVPDYLLTGSWSPQPTIHTLANAMDVSAPSNFERLRHLFPKLEELRKVVSAVSVSDAQIRATIQSSSADPVCPHTATALYVRHQLQDRDWVVVATAHPAKFETIVEPLIRDSLAVPAHLQTVIDRPTKCYPIGASLAEVASALK